MTPEAHASQPCSKSPTSYPFTSSPPPALTRGHNGGGGRIRTFEGVSRQIYSLLPLAAWVPLPGKTSRVFSWRPPGVSTGLARVLLRVSRYLPGSGRPPSAHSSIYVPATSRGGPNRPTRAPVGLNCRPAPNQCDSRAFVSSGLPVAANAASRRSCRVQTMSTSGASFAESTVNAPATR